jgi:hypothetical protein
VTLGVGLIAFEAAPGADHLPTIPAAAVPAGTPDAGHQSTLPGCTAAPRPAGSIETIMQTPPQTITTLPRFGTDPVHDAYVTQPIDGDLFLTKRPKASSADIDAINATLHELAACRFYAENADGRVDMTGRYFALYSDDYFRRELAGYREAGLPLRLVSFWTPNTPPTVVDARVFKDGRVAAVLRTGTEQHHPKWWYLAIFVHTNNRWLVDELGEVTLDPAPPLGTPSAPPKQELQIVLYDDIPGTPTIEIGTPNAQAGTRIVEGSGRTVCDGLGVENAAELCGQNFTVPDFHYSNFSADKDLHLRLINIGALPHQFIIKDLDIDVMVPPAGIKEITINASAGQYLFEIFEGASPIGAGVLDFVPAGTPQGVG